MIRVRQIKIPIEKDTMKELKEKVAKKLQVKSDQIEKIKINKRSLDARNKEQIYYVYEVDIQIQKEEKILNKTKPDILKTPNETYQLEITGTKQAEDITIVGSGPAGLFCAYLLAENGYHPIIIERGEKVEERVKTIEKFWETGILNKDSNVQFGEGGAGTFSDGKLNTLTKDKNFRNKKVFQILVENGAPKEIMYENNPHIGTDILQQVVKNIRNKIINMGGTIKYHSKLTNLEIKNGKLEAIEVNSKERIPCHILVLAIGHSARDTFEMLLEKGLKMSPKSFAVGVRIEHPQRQINEAQYGKKYKDILPPANYKLTYTTKEKRGVYSFCMCPGGYVVNASSEEQRLVVNGMSNYQRESKNANSALVVTVTPKDYGENILDGMAFQRNLEAAAYQEGQGKIPIQQYKDFKENKKSTNLGEVTPTTKGMYTLANLNNILPTYIADSLKEAIPHFSKKIKDFGREDAILLGVESRTSSPIKILRDEQGISNIKGIYPCGEGAGYAGGITTSAIDGIKVAEWIAKRYLPTK